jgi:hypothetical protein
VRIDELVQIVEPSLGDQPGATVGKSAGSTLAGPLKRQIQLVADAA